MAEDDLGAESTGNITAQVQVMAVNDPPTLTSFAAVVETTAEDTEVEISFADLAAQGDEADVDGTVDAFVVKSVASGSLRIGADAAGATAWAAGTNDTLDATTHAYWTAAANANGTLDAFIVVAEDNLGAESTGDITAQVQVTAVNDSPSGAPTITGTATEDEILTADTSGISDADGLGAFSYQWLRDGVAIGGATASTYTLGDADVGAQISVEVSYTDGLGTAESVTSAQTASVTNVNDAPSDVSLSANTVNENSPNETVIGIASASDSDVGDTFTHTLTDDAAGRFAIDSATGELRVADGSRLDFEAASSHDVTIRVTDAGGLSRSEVFTIDLNDVNEAPTASGEAYTTLQIDSLTISLPGVLANDHDVDDDLLTAALLSGVAHGSLTLNADGSFTYVPNGTFTGADGFTYVATDGLLVSSPITVAIHVEAAGPPGGGESTSPSDPPEEDPEQEDPEEEDPTDDTTPTEEQSSLEPAPPEVMPLAENGEEAIVAPPQAPSQAVDEACEELRVVEEVKANDDPIAQLSRGAIRTSSGAVAMSPDHSPLPIRTSSDVMSRAPLSLFVNSENGAADVGGDSSVTTQEIVLGTTKVVSTALSVGYAVWLVRGGALFASMVASLPAWMSLDPLPILTSFEASNRPEEEDDEKLCDLVH